MTAATMAEPLPDWMTDAACAAPETRGLPWTSDSHTVPDVLVDIMRDTCATCPVRLACAGYAMTDAVTGGFWTGSDRDPAVDVMAKFAEDVQLVGASVQELLPFDMPAQGAA